MSNVTLCRTPRGGANTSQISQSLWPPTTLSGRTEASFFRAILQLSEDLLLQYGGIPARQKPSKRGGQLSLCRTLRWKGGLHTPASRYAPPKVCGGFKGFASISAIETRQLGTEANVWLPRLVGLAGPASPETWHRSIETFGSGVSGWQNSWGYRSV